MVVGRDDRNACCWWRRRQTRAVDAGGNAVRQLVTDGDCGVGGDAAGGGGCSGCTTARGHRPSWD